MCGYDMYTVPCSLKCNGVISCQSWQTCAIFCCEGSWPLAHVCTSVSFRCCLPEGLSPERQQSVRQVPDAWGSQEDPFRACLVFTDPSDWYRDLQLLTDVLTSGSN